MTGVTREQLVSWVRRENQAALARRFGVTKVTIRRWLRAFDIPYPKKNGKLPSAGLTVSIATRLQAGQDQAEIARALGVTQQAISYRVLQSAVLSVFPRGPKPGPLVHGTLNAYKKRGCRCPDCRTVHAQSCRRSWLKRKQKDRADLADLIEHLPPA